MDQSTLDDDDLFGEAATELTDDIEAALTAAEDALPDAQAVWTPEGDNLLGELNTLKGTLEAEAAESSLREARKWLAVAQRAGAIDEDDALVERADELAATLEAMATAREAVGDLTGALPALRGELQAE